MYKNTKLLIIYSLLAIMLLISSGCQTNKNTEQNDKNEEISYEVPQLDRDYAFEYIENYEKVIHKDENYKFEIEVPKFLADNKYFSNPEDRFGRPRYEEIEGAISIGFYYGDTTLEGIDYGGEIFTILISDEDNEDFGTKVGERDGKKYYFKLRRPEDIEGLAASSIVKSLTPYLEKVRESFKFTDD